MFLLNRFPDAPFSSSDERRSLSNVSVGAEVLTRVTGPNEAFTRTSLRTSQLYTSLERSVTFMNLEGHTCLPEPEPAHHAVQNQSRRIPPGPVGPHRNTPCVCLSPAAAGSGSAGTFGSGSDGSDLSSCSYRCLVLIQSPSGPVLDDPRWSAQITDLVQSQAVLWTAHRTRTTRTLGPPPWRTELCSDPI